MNIAHRRNSVLATSIGARPCRLCRDQAGFGADLGAEKLSTSSTVSRGCGPRSDNRRDHSRSVSTVARTSSRSATRIWQLREGYRELERHMHNVHNHYGCRCGRVGQPIHRRYGRGAGAARQDHEGSRRAPVTAAWAEAREAPSTSRTRWSSLSRREQQAPSSWPATKTRSRSGTRSRRWRPRSMAPAISPPTRRSRLRSTSCRPTATGITRSASPRPSTRSPPIRLRGARRAVYRGGVREVQALAAGAEFIVVITGDVVMPRAAECPRPADRAVDAQGRVVGLF